MFETQLTKLLRKTQVASESDLIYVAKDNEIAHNALNDICKALVKRIENLEEYVSTQVTHPSNIRYRPDGQEDYMSLKQNLDFIYERLNNLEKT
jgi:DNA-binding Xre family transcriptional regulator